MRRRSMIFHALAAGAAVVVTAWFGLLAVQARDTDAAARIIGGPRPTAAQARQAAALLDTAGVLDPDRQIDLLRSQLAYAGGDKATARRLAAAVTRKEPDNPQAWLLLTNVSYGAPAAVALQRLAKLVPIVKSGS